MKSAARVSVALLGVLFVAVMPTEGDIGGHIADGNLLAKMCESDDQEALQACGAYVIGVHDTLSYIESAIDSPDTYATHICMPPAGAVSTSQMVKIAKKYIENHPEKLHYPAPVLVINALMDAFPCHE